ncbi:tetratricopeptide repeat protein [Kitasatospora sp. NBC_01287]|uniref:helix-turn-helix domain-containing protein n=1 Tax=Kitasatospora sp. NBC_01287 TaxID=2903573 RepID=UPI00224D7B6B|nr:helix-turn-helix domain-containing protein [Kitasatospora sp. NBC_01287]MCX4751368.1 tetratricopeptide repeat protein [Kitasatospora sp. NBC_01287]
MSGDFGGLLRQYRRRAGLTQEELAQRSGLSAHAISMLESGRRLPRLTSIARLAEGLGLPAADGEQLAASVQAEDAEEERPTAPPAPPPPAPDSVVPRLLPYAVADFTGRGTALTELTGRLRGPDPATVVISTIAGMGGIGKSTLAIEVAHRCRDDFPDGQLYVDLRGTTAPRDPGEVLSDLLGDLGVPPAAVPVRPEARAALYRSTLAGRRVLLVLDDARNAAQVRPLLPGTRGCGVLITSRSRLAALSGATRLDLGVLDDQEALALLTAVIGAERVAAEPAAAALIIRRCAGLPLAIRIAAARLASRPAWQLRTLADRLEGAHLLDEFTIEDVALRMNFQVSCEALETSGTAADRTAAQAFRLLGLWPGPFLELPAAAALLGLTEREVEPALEALVDAQLLENTSANRYTFHDLTRAYAYEQCLRHDPPRLREEAADRLLTWYLHSAANATDLMNPDQARAGFDRIPACPTALTFPDRPAAQLWCQRERENLGAAVALAAERPSVLSWVLPTSLMNYYVQYRHWADMFRAATLGLTAARRLGDQEAQAWTLIALSIGHRLLGRMPEALDTAREAMTMAELAQGEQAAQGAPVIGAAASLYASTLHVMERYEEAISWYETALPSLRAEGRLGKLAATLNNLGYAYNELGRYQEAITWYRRAIELLHEAPDPSPYGFVEATVLDSLGRAHHGLGELDLAGETLRAASDQRLQLGDQEGAATTLDRLGDVRLAAGERLAAREAWQRAAQCLTGRDHPLTATLRAKLDGASGGSSTSPEEPGVDTA